MMLMSNSVLPKEQMTAFQRWELASFDHPVIQPTQPKISDAELARQAAAQLAELTQQAHQDGYASGREVGYQAGYAEGIAQARHEAEQIKQLLDPLQTAINSVDEELAQSLLMLALEIAQKMTLQTLQTKPEIINKIVSEAIASLPHFNQNAHLILHPDDAKLVQEQLGEQLNHAGWKIFTDVQIQRGGCLVETAHSHIDATNTARWQRIVESIGQDTSWQA